MNPIENCIYLDSFDIEDKADILNNELLPYLLRLKNVSDVHKAKLLVPQVQAILLVIQKNINWIYDSKSFLMS